MKKFIFLCPILFSLTSYSQSGVKNGTIYKEHPYITVVNKMVDYFVKGDTVEMAKFCADTAKFSPPAGKMYALKQAKTNWRNTITEWTQITAKPQGYPDALQYDKDPFTVQSWWLISAVNKKTGKKAVFREVIFDMFNKDGKIVFESEYYDPTAIMEAMK